MTLATFETKTKFIRCAICKRETSEGHALKYGDIWICSWCGN